MSTRTSRLGKMAGDLQGIATGVFLVSLGLFLLHESHAVTGGLAGVALIVSYVVPTVPLGVLYFGITVPFLVLAFWRKGVAFGIRTTAALASVSALAVLHPLMIGGLAIDTVYGTLTGNLLAGLGMVILFRHGASLGGINTVALLLEERFGWRVAYVQGGFDLAVVALSLAVIAPGQVALSIAGVVLLNLVLAFNHRPAAGRAVQAQERKSEVCTASIASGSPTSLTSATAPRPIPYSSSSLG